MDFMDLFFKNISNVSEMEESLGAATALYLLTLQRIRFTGMGMPVARLEWSEDWCE